jgi:hypothetical protein
LSGWAAFVSRLFSNAVCPLVHGNRKAMRSVVSYALDAVRAILVSLGLVRAIVGLLVAFALLRYYDVATAPLAQKGWLFLPSLSGAWLAAGFLLIYAFWHVVRLAVRLEREAKPTLTMKILDPEERYETFVSLGNRLLRLYHLEVANGSRTRTARKVGVSLRSYHKAGDKRQVDIRSPLKIANTETEELDLKPQGCAVFELIGVEADGADMLGIAEAREEQTFSIVPAGSGRISVVAEGHHMPPTEQTYTLYIDHNGAMTIKPQGEMRDITDR